MSHFLLFKQSSNPAVESARAKEQEKVRLAMEKARKELEKQDQKERQRRASAIQEASAPVAGHPAASGSHGEKSKGWWRRNSATAPKGCFSAEDEQGRPEANMAMRPPIQDSPLLVEVRSAWTSAFKVVYKDLPRLAKRMSIQTEELGTLIEAGRIVRIPIPQQISAAGQDGSASSSSSAVAASSSSPQRGARSQRAHSIGSWEAWKGMENESWIGKEAVRRANQEIDQQERAQREKERAAVGGSGGLSSDDEEKKYPSPDSAAAVPSHPHASLLVTPVPGEIDTWQAVCNVLLCTLEHLESPEVVFAARSALAVATSSMHQGSDHQSILEGIFTQIIGTNSRTFKIFQAIHQSILFPAIAHLHQKLYSHPAIGNLKDCRRADGWTVQIHLGSAIYITHTRWEQSLQPEHDPRHFEVRWEMRLSFDKQLQQLRAVILRIQELAFHPDAPAEYRFKIKEILAGSGYIV